MQHTTCEPRPTLGCGKVLLQGGHLPRSSVSLLDVVSGGDNIGTVGPLSEDLRGRVRGDGARPNMYAQIMLRVAVDGQVLDVLC